MVGLNYILSFQPLVTVVDAFIQRNQGSKGLKKCVSCSELEADILSKGR